MPWPKAGELSLRWGPGEQESSQGPLCHRARRVEFESWGETPAPGRLSGQQGPQGGLCTLEAGGPAFLARRVRGSALLPAGAIVWEHTGYGGSGAPWDEVQGLGGDWPPHLYLGDPTAQVLLPSSMAGVGDRRLGGNVGCRAGTGGHGSELQLCMTSPDPERPADLRFPWARHTWAAGPAPMQEHQ